MLMMEKFSQYMKKGRITWSRSTKIKNKLLALNIFRLIRPFLRVQIDTEDHDYGYIYVLYVYIYIVMLELIYTEKHNIFQEPNY